jgi:succinate-semialdehyde dehydrogenase
MRKFLSRNPFTGKVLKEYDFVTDSELDAKIQRAGSAYHQMIGKSQRQKADELERLANVMEANAKQYAEIITAEMGKPIVAARGEITKAIGHCRYFAKHLPEYLNPTHLKTEAKRKLL